MTYYNPTKKLHSHTYGEDVSVEEGDVNICEKWNAFYKYILIEQFPGSTLGSYSNSYRDPLDRVETGGPQGEYKIQKAPLFSLKRTQCIEDYKIGGKTIYDIINDPKSVFNKEDFINNPYEGILDHLRNISINEDDGEILCRELNKDGKFCDESPGSLTIDRRAAAWGCGLGMLFGVDQAGDCNPNFTFKGLKDDLEDITDIINEFESLSFLCAGSIISSVQCNLLKNFSTQNQIYKELSIKRKELINYKLYPVKLRVTCILLLTMLIVVFLQLIRVFK